MTVSQSHSTYIHPDIWVAVLKQAMNFILYNRFPYPGDNHSMAASLSWLDRREILPKTVLDDLKSRLWKAVSWHLDSPLEDGDGNTMTRSVSELLRDWQRDTNIPHVAQHFRELFRDWRQLLTGIDNSAAKAFAIIVGDAHPCTECPGTPPAQWPDKPETASATVPSPTAPQDTNLPSIAGTSVVLAVSSAADPASSPTPSAAPAASNSEHSLHTVSILEPVSVLISSVTPHIDGDDELPTAADAIAGAEAPGSAISAPSASESSKALDSDFDASPQGPAHLGTDEDALDSSSSTGEHDADVGHPEPDEHDREAASEPRQTSSEIAVGDTAVTPKPDASADGLVAPRDIPIADAESDLPHTTRSVTSDNEDL